MKPARLVLVTLIATGAFAQAASETSEVGATMRQLMLDLIHPASNDIVLFVNRGVPKSDVEWANVRRSAIVLAESGTLLTMRTRARDQGEWMKDAKMLADVGRAAYQASQGKDFNALAALTDSLDASCTACHKQYRPNVFPRSGGPGASK